MFNQSKKNVYFIMGSQNVTKSPTDVLEEAIQAGIDCFQFREKGSHAKTKMDKFLLGMKLRVICKVHDVPFIVNDDVELAKELDADGVHLGQDDMTIKEARIKLPATCKIGISTSNLTEALQAEKDGADYIGVGPIFTTTTKEDAKRPIGLEMLQKIKQSVKIPVVAIGGIGVDHADSVFDHGADAVAVISAIAEADCVKEAVVRLKS